MCGNKQTNSSLLITVDCIGFQSKKKWILIVKGQKRAWNEFHTVWIGNLLSLSVRRKELDFEWAIGIEISRA